jgi:FkbM family methyltransferase
MNKNGELLLINHLAGQCHFFVDAGANRGEWSRTVMSHNPGAKGVLFEPSKQCYKELVYLFDEVDILVVNSALTDYVGSTGFAEEAGFGQTSALSGLYHDEGKTFRIHTVSTDTLDHYFDHSDKIIDYLKIDAEGADFLIIKGATNLMHNCQLRCIQFEYNLAWANAGSSLGEAKALLESKGYSVFIIRPNGLYTIDLGYWGEYYQYTNYLACHNSSLSLIQDLVRSNI